MADETKVMQFTEPQDVTDAEIVKDEIIKPMDAYLLVRRILPETGTADLGPKTEGIRLPLPADGKLTPEIINGFLGEAYVTKLPDGRTIVLSTRLINNHIITESYSAASIEELDEDYAVRVCQAKTKNRLLDMLEFLWASATYTPAQVAAEQEYMAKFSPNKEDEAPAPTV